MPVIIELTSLNGAPVWVNAANILQFARAFNQDSTLIYFSLNDEIIHVEETPGEIMNKIGMASTIETETTVYTDDSNRPEVYTL